MQKATAVKVGATAGLRLLPDGQADKLLEAVTAHLKKTTPFKLDTVSIIDGEHPLPPFGRLEAGGHTVLLLRLWSFFLSLAL